MNDQYDRVAAAREVLRVLEEKYFSGQQPAHTPTGIALARMYIRELLEEIDELRHTIEVLKADKYNADTENFRRAYNKVLDEMVRQAQEDGEYDV